MFSFYKSHWFDTIDFTTLTEINDDDLEKIIINAPHVKKLNIGWCTNITPVSFQLALWQFEKLEAIDIRGCKFSNKVCFEIGNYCQNLKSLNLSGATYLQDYVIENIAKTCIYLNEIRLSGCELLTKLSVEYLTLNEHINLFELDLSWINNVVGAQTCRRISNKFQQLRGLKLSHTPIVDEALLYFYKCTDLTSLDISFSPNLHDKPVAELLSEFNLLTELNLEGCLELGENAIDSIIQYCRMIEILNISMLENIDDNLVDKIAINLNDLKELYVDHCQKVTDKSLKHLARELRETLALLSIRCNKNITNNGLICFSENMMALSTLNLTACVSCWGTIYTKN